ncbi:AAA family ATPase [Campylobacter concisus]|uniref:McrBC 5-methylcytosine restriction system, component McrB n=2 Tax=Campylobacter concisus TaxID=199 RepID=A0A0M5MIQ9_9BACT|nr:AAA family ATPase [Campylobacter concisus]ALF47705.1 McrBC 5-methylcytosine restriction system, component McrB [Campylobacter concisus]
MINDDLKNKILYGFKYFTNRYAQDITYRKGDKTTHDKLSNFCENFKIFSNDIFSEFKIVDHGKWQNSGNISKYIWNRYKPFKNESHLVIYFAVLAKPSNFYISIGLIDTKLSDAEKKLKNEIYNFLESECKKIHIPGFRLDKLAWEKYIYFAIENIETFATLDYTSLLNALTNVYHLTYEKFYKNTENNQQNNSDSEGYKMTDDDKKSTSPLNQILYGPPGTGKTYSTVTKAIEIIEERKVDISKNRNDLKKKFDGYIRSGQIKFVTFHQSYGYEEFVEGIKPILGNSETDNNKEIKYDIEDGIFKTLCKMAQNIEGKTSNKFDFNDNINFWKMSLGDSQKPEEDFVFEYCIKNNVVLLGFGDWINFSGCENAKQISKRMEKEMVDFSATAINRLKNEIKNGDIILISLGNKKLRAVARVTGEYKYLDRDDLESFVQARSVEWIFIPDEPIYYEKILYKQFSQMSIYNIKDNLKIDEFKQIFTKDSQKIEKNYILIIDEINRGNISKIFGELITLIEPSKRLGADDEIMVELPYSKEKFGVPSNLYIIGTMNTADRSIALMDTALRRRFEFVEMMPQPELLKDIKIIKNGDDTDIKLNEMLKTINDRIEYLYDRDHTIGHAYFMSLKDGADIEELASIFKNKILPLLQEYFYDDWEKIRLVLGDNGLIKEKEKDRKLLVLDGKEYETDKILYEIKFEAFKEPENYIKIYEQNKMQEQ